MRTTTILAAAAITLTGCISPRIIDPDVACRNRVVTVNHASGSIVVAPPHLEMCAGYQLTVNIVPRAGGRMAGVRATDSGREIPNADTTWLNREAANGRIQFTLPSGQLIQGATYKYSVEIDGVGLIDPTIGIIVR